MFRNVFVRDVSALIGLDFGTLMREGVLMKLG